MRAVDSDGQPLSYRVIDGALPPVLTLQPDGSFTGMAIAPGTYRVTVQACDNSDPPACDDVALTLAVTAGEVDPTALPRPPAGPPVTPDPIAPDVGGKTAVAPPKGEPLPAPEADGRRVGSSPC